MSATRSGHGRPGVGPVVAGLVAAVLAAVEHVEARQPAPVERPVDAQVRAGGGVEPHGHVLPPGPVAGGPPGRKLGGLGGELGDEAGVVVLDLVVVPGDDPRARGVDALQRRVALVLPVAVAVVVERDQLGAGVLADRPGADAALVDVVAQVEHHVRVVGRGVGPQRPEAGLPVLAAGEQEPQRVAVVVPGRGGAGAADGADLVADDEPVPVPRGGAQVADVDVDRVGVLGGGHDVGPAHVPPERLVLGHLDPDRDVDGGHAPAGRRRRRQAGPEDDRVVGRVAGRHAQREQAVRQRDRRRRWPATGVRRRVGATRRAPAGQRDRGAGHQCPGEEPAPARAGVVAGVAHGPLPLPVDRSADPIPAAGAGERRSSGDGTKTITRPVRRPPGAASLSMVGAVGRASRTSSLRSAALGGSLTPTRPPLSFASVPDGSATPWWRFLVPIPVVQKRPAGRALRLAAGGGLSVDGGAGRAGARTSLLRSAAFGGSLTPPDRPLGTHGGAGAV